MNDEEMDGLIDEFIYIFHLSTDYLFAVVVVGVSESNILIYEKKSFLK